MSSPVRILHLEDNLLDAELVRGLLAAEGLACEIVRVETKADFVSALDRGGFDLIISDFTLPAYDGHAALNHARTQCPDVPLLFFSGTLGEDAAVEALKNGSTDYVLKQRPARLGPAVRRALREARERAELQRAQAQMARMERVRETLGQFVTPEVADFVLANPLDFWKQGERRVVTVLFADVRGSTAFLAHVEPEEVVSVLNEIFAVVIDAVQREGGILNKFLGDGLMALFGAPIPLENHAQAAARAALRARNAIEAMSKARHQLGLTPLRIGIGINTGEVVAGCVGMKERTEYSVIGHAVNLAARFEEAAAPGQILLGLETGKLLHEAFEVGERPSIQVTGLSEPIPVMELISEKRSRA
jgi:class 3 adenylate cyclase